jgi:outer membrane protein assembly complex protein YaeT
MRSVAPCFAGVFVLLTAVVASADVGDYLGKPVASIRLTSEGHDTIDQRLLRIVQTRVGRPLTMVDVRETMVHLFSLGRFEDVLVRADITPGGVSLIYELMPVYPVERIRFIGSLEAPGIGEGRLRRAVVDRYGPSPPSAHAPDVARLLEGQLRERGYLRAAVTPRVELQHAPDRAVLTFRIDAGARARVGAIHIVGSPGMPEKDLLDRLDLSTGAPYERDALNARIAHYIEDRRKHGYFEARLTPAVQLADEDRLANLTLTAAEGPHVRVAFKGDPLPADRRDELVPISREGSADEDLLEDASNGIADYLHAQGYRDATAPHARELSDGELLITFTVTRGPQYRVADVEISGNTSIPLADFQPRLRLRKGQPFASALLDADLSAIEDIYHRRGFALARAQEAIDPASASAPDASLVSVVVGIHITENAQTTVESVRVEGNLSVPEPAVRDALGLQPGRPFFLAQMALDRDAIQLQYANLGYPNATVDGNPGFSPDQRRADVVFTVHEGPRIFVEHVLITGNTRTSIQIIERQLQLKSGDPLGLSALTESQRRLAALGLFRRVRITELAHGDETMRDVLVTVEEAPATTVGYGGGLEVGQYLLPAPADSAVATERLAVAPRGFFEIGRRNLFGSNRSINLFTRISLRPRGTLASQPTGSSSVGFNEYRVLGTFREPRVFGTAADSSLTGTVEQQIRASFNFARRAFGAEIARRVSPTLSLSGNYQIQRIEIFDERLDVKPQDKLRIDQLFPQVRLSSFSLSAIHDNHDALNPRDGHYLSANAQLAARAIGSEVGFVRSYLTAQLFRLLPRTHATVFGASARLGMAAGFPQSGTLTADPTQPNLPASERFFAGGDTTVRGFALDQLGSPATIKGGFPIGGNAVVILNAELRVPVHGGLGVVGFLDTGNVFARAMDIDLGQLRSSVGFGVRYRSPVGPIRVDLGFKVDRKEIAPGTLESPRALHISLGQAF